MKDELYGKYKNFIDTHPEILNEKLNMYVGTNEDTHYRLSDIDVKYISDEDMEAIISALGIHLYSAYAEYGILPNFLDDISNWCENKGIEYPNLY
jgi:hypothetical protein